MPLVKSIPPVGEPTLRAAVKDDPVLSRIFGVVFPLVADWLLKKLLCQRSNRRQLRRMRSNGALTARLLQRSGRNDTEDREGTGIGLKGMSSCHQVRSFGIASA